MKRTIVCLIKNLYILIMQQNLLFLLIPLLLELTFEMRSKCWLYSDLFRLTDACDFDERFSYIQIIVYLSSFHNIKLPSTITSETILIKLPHFFYLLLKSILIFIKFSLGNLMDFVSKFVSITSLLVINLG